MPLIIENADNPIRITIKMPENKSLLFLYSLIKNFNISLIVKINSITANPIPIRQRIIINILAVLCDANCVFNNTKAVTKLIIIIKTISKS